jgi:hypothetical protein
MAGKRFRGLDTSGVAYLALRASGDSSSTPGSIVLVSQERETLGFVDALINAPDKDLADVLLARVADVQRLSTVSGMVQVPAARDREAFEELSLPDDAEPLLLRKQRSEPARRSEPRGPPFIRRARG